MFVFTPGSQKMRHDPESARHDLSGSVCMRNAICEGPGPELYIVESKWNSDARKTAIQGKYMKNWRAVNWISYNLSVFWILEHFQVMPRQHPG
jgi:hypothetical protein